MAPASFTGLCAAQVLRDSSWNRNGDDLWCEEESGTDLIRNGLNFSQNRARLVESWKRILESLLGRAVIGRNYRLGAL